MYFRYRPVFNWLHGGLGVSAAVLALVSTWLATQLETAGLPTATEYLVYGYCGWLVVCHVSFTAYKMMKWGEAPSGLEDDRVVKTGWVVFMCGVVSLCLVVVIMVCIKN